MVGKQILGVTGYALTVESQFAVGSVPRYYRTIIKLRGVPSPGSKVKGAELVFAEYPFGHLPPPRYNESSDSMTIYYPAVALSGVLPMLELATSHGVPNPFGSSDPPPVYCVYRDDLSNEPYADVEQARNIPRDDE